MRRERRKNVPKENREKDTKHGGAKKCVSHLSRTSRQG